MVQRKSKLVRKKHIFLMKENFVARGEAALAKAIVSGTLGARLASGRNILRFKSTSLSGTQFLS